MSYIGSSLLQKLYFMKEYMLLIRNTSDSKASFTAEKHKEFVTACEIYIGKLIKGGNLIAAQPLIREGHIISGKPATWKNTPLDMSKDIQVGYYHILAKDMNEAIEIAKGNPEFEYTPGASAEIRPIKMKEEVTGFVYPKED
jgi:hypothetical protein